VIAVAVTLFAVSLILLVPSFTLPSSVLGQSMAVMGSSFLLIPFLFSLFKRSGISKSPPSWFVAHVIFALMGSILIAVHVSSGNWLTPPGIILVCLVFLIIQGLLLRVVLSKRLSLLFAKTSTMQGFKAPNAQKIANIQQVINNKIQLLALLDNTQDEALFSPALKHWFWHPIKSMRYQLLADKEAKLMGVKQINGLVMNWSRRIHLLVAFLFFASLLSHIIIVLFFAGYAAQGQAIDWWYITAWGG